MPASRCGSARARRRQIIPGQSVPRCSSASVSRKLPRLRVAVEERPIFPTPYRILAACYAHMGLLAEAQATVARLRTLTSEVIPTYPLPFRDPAHRELYYSGLRLALGEEAIAG